jgi:hypothetical protein
MPISHHVRIPAGVVCAEYCTDKGDIKITEKITEEIRKHRWLECAYPPKHRGKPHPDAGCVFPCFNCMGPGGVPCCCNCPPS